MFQERLNGLAILLIDKEMLEEFEKKKKKILKICPEII